MQDAQTFASVLFKLHNQIKTTKENWYKNAAIITDCGVRTELTHTSVTNRQVILSNCKQQNQMYFPSTKSLHD